MSRPTSNRLVLLVLALGGFAGVSHSQQVLSAQSGTIHYTEGTVYLDGSELHAKHSQFATMRPGQELRTEGGRAEVLLTPGAFLRVGNHSAVRMVENRLSDTRVEVVEGSVIAECDDLLKYNAITLLYGGKTIQLLKHGLYRVDTAPAQLRVFDGEAIVESASGPLRVRHGKEVPLDGVAVAEKFHHNAADSLDLWDKERSELLAAASAGASQSLLNSHTAWTSSGWSWNPFYGLYTFVPLSGTIYSPFGWQFWSPSAMSIYYTPYGSNGNYSASNGSAGGGSWTGGMGGSSSSGNATLAGGSRGLGGGGVAAAGGAGGGRSGR